jgi:addiction module HigA family antidote
MENPPHPGEIMRDLCIKPLGLTVTKAAEGLGITRKTLSSLLNGHAGISPEMAARLSQAFGRSPESWLQLQGSYESRIHINCHACSLSLPVVTLTGNENSGKLKMTPDKAALPEEELNRSAVVNLTKAPSPPLNSTLLSLRREA